MKNKNKHKNRKLPVGFVLEPIGTLVPLLEPYTPEKLELAKQLFGEAIALKMAATAEREHRQS